MSAIPAVRDINPASFASEREKIATPIVRAEHLEDVFTRVLEQQTAKIPSSWFLAGALAAMGLSALFELRGRTRPSRFVGMWPPALLLMGVYNKIVKNLGSR